MCDINVRPVRQCGNALRGGPFRSGRDCYHQWKFWHDRTFNLKLGGGGNIVAQAFPDDGAVPWPSRLPVPRLCCREHPDPAATRAECPLCAVYCDDADCRLVWDEVGCPDPGAAVAGVRLRLSRAEALLLERLGGTPAPVPAAALAVLEAQAKAPPPEPPAPGDRKPGRHLAALLERWGLKKCLPCGGKAGQMDAWGPDGCRGHRAEIIGWLEGARAQQDWPTVMAAIAYAAVDRLLGKFCPNPLDVYGSLVDEAIRRSEATAA